MGIREKFEEEKAAKNRAYAFILSMGLLPQFQKFVNETYDIDPHELSIKLFAIM